MNLKSLRIKNFGKFADKEIEFKNGINIVYGENESGKTTLFNFIKGMLFGIDKQRGKASKTDTYSIYEPWNNSIFYEGVLRFRAADKNFRIERSFNKLTKFTNLINEDDGEELEVEKGDLTQLLDGLDEKMFTNTVGIDQVKTFSDDELANSVKNYISGFSGTDGENINVAAAVESLKSNKRDAENKKKKVIGSKQLVIEKLNNEKEYIQKDIENKNGQIKQFEDVIKDKSNKINQENITKRKKIINLLTVNVIMLIALIICLLIFKSLIMSILAIIVIFLYNIFNTIVMAKIKDRVYDSDAELNKYKGSLKSIKDDIKEKSTQISNLEESIIECLNNNDEIEKIDTEIKAYELAIEHIEEALYDMQKELDDMINNDTSQIMSFITDGKYNDIKLDSNINARINSKDKLIAQHQLSRGTLDELNFSIRMVYMNMFFNNEKMPVLLDDAFAMYDEKRLERTLKYLAECNMQVIIFTCHKREKELADKQNILYNYITLTP